MIRFDKPAFQFNKNVRLLIVCLFALIDKKTLNSIDQTTSN